MKAEEYLVSLKESLVPHQALMNGAVDAILEQGVSLYPILVLHQVAVELGISVVEKLPIEGGWSVNASTLEEFVARQIINSEKIESFKKVYKDPTNFLCLFVISEFGATFVFTKRI